MCFGFPLDVGPVFRLWGVLDYYESCATWTVALEYVSGNLGLKQWHLKESSWAHLPALVDWLLIQRLLSQLIYLAGSAAGIIGVSGRLSSLENKHNMIWLGTSFRQALFRVNSLQTSSPRSIIS